MNRLTLNSDIRVYVQMKLDLEGVRAFEQIGTSLSPQKNGRLLPPEEIHLTLIHFGKVDDVYAAVRRVVPLTGSDYIAHLTEYVTRTQVVITNESYHLLPQNYERFGARHTTLVARYDAPERLNIIHAAAYDELLRFFAACGIAQPDAFARADHNFIFAREFTPHVTIYKGYSGDVPKVALPKINATFMPLVY